MHPILDLLESVKANGQNQWLARCPAHADREPSLSVRQTSDGHILLYCFAGCAVENVLESLGLTMCDLYAGDVSHGHSKIYKTPASTPDKTCQEKLERLWNAACLLNGQDKASTYLTARGVRLKRYPDTLRFVPRLEYWHRDEEHYQLLGYFPALIARVIHPQYELVAFHRTYLHSDGKRKADVPKTKKLSPPVFDGATKGAAIKLFEASERLAVSEGIETALAVHVATGWSVWSCISAVGLEHVLIPNAVHEVIICADHDRAGMSAANILARRLLSEGKRVRLATPPLEGMDWLDMLNHQVVVS